MAIPESAREYRQTLKDMLIEMPDKRQRRDFLASERITEEYKTAREFVIFERHQSVRTIPDAAIRRERYEFPITPTERLGALLSSVNTGTKSILLFLLERETRPETYISPVDLADKFKEAFRGTELLEQFGNHTKQLVTQYCQQSLVGIGVVAREYTLAGELVGFSLTPDGRRYGISAAALALKTEEELGTSLYPILGQSTSRLADSRAPLTRARILEALSRRDQPVRVADLELELGTNDVTIGNDLELLDRLGIVDYRSFSHKGNTTMIRYITPPEFTGDSIEPINRTRSIQNLMVKILQDHKPETSFTDDQIYEQMPDSVKTRWKERELKAHISRLLSKLVREGHILREDNLKGAETHSSATLTELGYRFFNLFERPMLALVQDQPIDNSAIDSVRNNLFQYARMTADLYLPFSRSTRIRQSGETQTRILELIRDSEEPLTIKDVFTQLDMSKQSAISYIKSLTQNGVLKRTKIGKTYFYQV